MSYQNTSHSPTSKIRKRFLYLVVFLLLACSLLLRLALALNREIDIDEFQHLHAAWMISQHYLIYKDFWENHTPLFYYLLLPLFRLCREGPGLVIVARIIMSIASLGILWLTYLLARIRHKRETALLAVLILSWMVIFAQKSIEVRPDQLLITLWLASLWISIAALSTVNKSRLSLAGFLLGVAFLLSPKALLPYAAISFTFLVHSYLPHPRRGFLRFLKIEIYYTLGFLVPVTICLALLYRAGILREMLTLTLSENFRYPDTYRPSYLLWLRNICFFLLAAAGVVINLRSLKNESLTAVADRLLLLLPALFLLVVFLFLEAAPYPQSVLLFAPLLAIYGAEALQKALDGLMNQRSDESKWIRVRMKAQNLLCVSAAVAAGLVIPGAILLLKAHPFHRTNAQQFERMEYVLRITRPTDVVFDGQSAYVFRPQAYFYSSLFHAIEGRIQRGEVKQNVPESLRRTNCGVVIYDERVSLLPPSIQTFLKANYEASPEPEVYLKKSAAPHQR